MRCVNCGASKDCGSETCWMVGDRDAELDACRHEWVYTGTAYGGDDERWHGEGRSYCALCGADGDG